MNKNRIRLTESQLHRVIKESVHKVLNEISYGDTPKQGNPYDDWNGGFGDNWSDEQWAEYNRRRAEKYKDMPDRDYLGESDNYKDQSQYSPAYMCKDFEVHQRTDKNGKKHFKRVEHKQSTQPKSEPFNTDEWQEQYRDNRGYIFSSKGSGANKQWKRERVSESQLHKVIKESLKKVLNEIGNARQVANASAQRFDPNTFGGKMRRMFNPQKARQSDRVNQRMNNTVQQSAAYLDNSLQAHDSNTDFGRNPNDNIQLNKQQQNALNTLNKYNQQGVKFDANDVRPTWNQRPYDPSIISNPKLRQIGYWGKDR